MQRQRFLPLLAAATAVAAGSFSVAAPAARGAMLAITEAMVQSGTGNTGTPDWFELTNNSTAPATLTGFTMDDNSYAFATSVALNNVTTLRAGESAVFIELDTTTAADPASTATSLSAFRSYWGLNAAVQVGYYSGSGVSLSANGDGIVVFNAAGAEVVPRVVFATATVGSTFFFDPNANATAPAAVSPLGVSMSGQRGAYTSTGTYSPNGFAGANIGSPGLAAGVVPEPATSVLLGFAGAAGVVALHRRRRMARTV